MNKINKLVLTYVISAACYSAFALTDRRTAYDANGNRWEYTLTDGVAILGHGEHACCSISGTVSIPVTLDGYPVKIVGTHAFYQCSPTKIIIPSSVEEIAEKAFDQITSLTELHIPSSVKLIGNEAFGFAGNMNLTVKIESLAAWCETRFATNTYSNAGAYDIIYPLSHVSAQTTPFCDAVHIYFDGQEIVSDWDLVIPEGVTRINTGAFFLSHKNTSGMRENIKVKSITLPSTLKEIETCAFNSFRFVPLTINLPPHLEKLGRTAFGDAVLRTVNVPEGMPFIENLKGGLRNDVMSFPTINISAANTNYLQSGNGIYSADGKTFLMLRWDDEDVDLLDGVTRIAPLAFVSQEENYLTKIVLPDSVTEISELAFANCALLTNVTIGTNIREIGTGAFYSCPALESFDIPSTVSNLGAYAFSECVKLKGITLPSMLESIEQGLFAGCSGLVSVKLPTALKSIGRDAFFGCRSLSDISIPTGVVSVGEHAFYNTAVGDAFIPGSVLELGKWPYAGCDSLTNVVLGAGLRGIGGFTYIGADGSLQTWDSRYTFDRCRNIKSLTIESANTIIGHDAFVECLALDRVTMPSGCSFEPTAFTQYYSTPTAITLVLSADTEKFDQAFVANAHGLRPYITCVEIPSSCIIVDVAGFSQLVNLTKVIFRGASFATVNDSVLLNLRMGGIGISYIPEGGTEVEGEAMLKERLGNLSSVMITSSAVRANNASVLDVQYVAAGMTNRFVVRSLAFQDGVRSFSNVIRPTSFVDGTATNAYGVVPANEPHVISWKISDDWTVSLGHVAFEVMTVESAELPLKLVKIPATANHSAIRFSCNALTPARVLDALFWYYADPNCGLTLMEGKLMDGETLLANGMEPTAAGTAYVFTRMGYQLLTGAELEYANSISRLGLVPDGPRQYAVEYPAE